MRVSRGSERKKGIYIIMMMMSAIDDNYDYYFSIRYSSPLLSYLLFVVVVVVTCIYFYLFLSTVLNIYTKKKAYIYGSDIYMKYKYNIFIYVFIYQ